MNTIYKFKRGSYMRGDAQAVGEKLSAIRRARGSLTPYDVVQEARRESSVLHPFFEWNDEQAADEYRRQQARRLIRCIVLVEHEQYEITRPIRAFVSITEEAESSYENTVDVLSDADMRERLLVQLQSALDEHKEKLEVFQELADIIDGIEVLQERVRKHSGQESRTAGSPG